MITDIEIQAIEDFVNILPQEERDLFYRNDLRLIEKIKAQQKLIDLYELAVDDTIKILEGKDNG